MRGPLEDSGGFPGYEEIMDALADPSHPDYAEHSMGGRHDRLRCAFDPACLDIPAVNQALAAEISGKNATNDGTKRAPFTCTPPAYFNADNEDSVKLEIL